MFLRPPSLYRSSINLIFPLIIVLSHFTGRTMSHSSSLIAKCAQPPIVLKNPGVAVPPSAAVIFIHGLGDTGSGWMDVGEMVVNQLPHIKVILPTAPIRKITINGGMKMTGWYDIPSLSSRDGEDFEGLGESRDIIESIVESELAQGISSERIIIAGFSQGGAMTLFFTYQFNKKLAAAITLSGYLPCRNQWKNNVAEVNKGTPLLMYHGESDPVVQFSWAKDSFQAVTDAGIQGEFLSEPHMGHTASMNEIKKVIQFIQNHLPSV